MKDTIEQLKKAVTGLFKFDTQAINWEQKPTAGKWSKKEIIGHLIDNAQVNLQRLVRCTYQENFKLTYEQAEWVIAQHYQQADTSELLSLWRRLNNQIIGVLENYPANRLQATCETGKNAQRLHKVERLAQDHAVHLNHHLKQIY